MSGNEPDLNDMNNFLYNIDNIDLSTFTDDQVDLLHWKNFIKHSCKYLPTKHQAHMASPLTYFDIFKILSQVSTIILVI